MAVWRLVRQQKRFLIVIFIISVFLRLFFFGMFLRNNPLQLAFDSGHYHEVAVAVADGKGFINGDGSVHCYRLPGYPIFLALCYKFFQRNIDYVLLVQILLASLIPLLAFVLSMMLFPSVLLAKILSLLCAAHIGLLIFSGLVMSETIFEICFLLFIIFFLFSLERQSHWLVSLVAGLFLGATALVRPVGVWILLLSIVFIICAVHGRRKKYEQAILLCCGWACIAGIWLLRNFLYFGAFFLHTLSGPHFLNHGAVRVMMYAHNMTYQQAQHVVYQQYEEMLKQAKQQKRYQLNEYESSQIAEQCAARIFLQHPICFVQLCALNVVKTVLSLYAAELLFIDSGGILPPYDAHRSWVDMFRRFLLPSVHNRWILLVIYAEIIMHCMMLIGAFGFLISLMMRRREVSPQLAYMFLVSAVFIGLSCMCGFARLRLPIEPFFIMLTVLFWMRLITGKRVA